MPAPTLDEVLDILHEIAPLELAAEWDNVGVLLRPNQEVGPVKKCMLTIDLTEAVVVEAKNFGADLVVAYHPPIFKPLGRLDAADASQRRVIAALQAGFVVYSPHTALDATAGGLADWLIEVFSFLMITATSSSISPYLERDTNWFDPTKKRVVCKHTRFLEIRANKILAPPGVWPPVLYHFI